MSHKEKVLQYLDAKGVTPNKFCITCGFSNGFLGSGKYFGTDKLTIILDNYQDLSLEWLLFGKGEMLLQQQGLGILSEPTQLQQELLYIKRLLEKEEQHTADLRELLNLQNNSKKNAG